MSLFKEIKRDLINFPDEAIREWLLPYANEIGWPSLNKRWEGIFFGKTLEFWKTTSWTKKKLDLTAIPFSIITVNGLNEMRQAYMFSVDNLYKRIIKDGPQRYLHTLSYALRYDKPPGIVCLLYENNQYSIVDGNHRILGWLVSRDAIRAIAKMEKSDNKEHKERLVRLRQSMRKKWGTSSIAPFSSIQEVWVATP